MVRRHRRIIAAILAGLSVLFIIGALRPPAPQPVPSTPLARIQANEVGVPIAIANPALVNTLKESDVVDVIALDSLTPVVIARRARIITTSDGGVLLVGVTANEAMALTALSIEVPLTVQVHPASLP
jgi:hypothetical protein